MWPILPTSPLALSSTQCIFVPGGDSKVTFICGMQADFWCPLFKLITSWWMMLSELFTKQAVLSFSLCAQSPCVLLQTAALSPRLLYCSAEMVKWGDLPQAPMYIPRSPSQISKVLSYFSTPLNKRANSASIGVLSWEAVSPSSSSPF